MITPLLSFFSTWRTSFLQAMILHYKFKSSVGVHFRT